MNQIIPSENDELVSCIPRSALADIISCCDMEHKYTEKRFENITSIYEIVDYDRLDAVEYEARPRGELEKDINYLQFIVCCYIYDEDNNVLLLNNLTGGMKGKITLVEGHCQGVTNHLVKHLHHEMLREFTEELDVIYGKYELYDMIQEALTHVIIAEDNNTISSYHIGFIYHIITDNIHKYISNEPQRHTVEITDKRAVKFSKNIDNWASIVCSVL